MTKRKIVPCVECPERCDRLISIETCDMCDYLTPFNCDKSTVDCSYGE